MAKKKDYTIPALFVTAVVLVFIFLIVSLIFGGKKYPSVKNGATTSEVEQYAYDLLKQDNNSMSVMGYNEATSYYTTQIEAATDREQKFNLMLDFATFYGKTGDPYSGLQVLGSIDTASIPVEARYYLYTAYVYLYDRLGDESLAASYRQKIADEYPTPKESTESKDSKESQ